MICDITKHSWKKYFFKIMDWKFWKTFVSFGLSLVIIWSLIVKFCIFTFREAVKFKVKMPEDNICIVYLLTTSLFCFRRSMLVSEKI